MQYHPSMHISLTELRRSPGPALNHVRAGEEVIVTEDGIPMCRMVPVDRPTLYERLIADGTLRLPKEPRDPVEMRAAILAQRPVTPK